MIYYIVVFEEFDVTMYYPYPVYNDIVRYYNIANILHSHECIQTHHTLTIF